MCYAKMYFSENREIFQYDSLGTQGVPDVRRELPFLESLLSFQELDCAEVTPLLQCIAEDWSRFIAEDDRGALENAMKTLGELASVHIYFQLLYVHCYYRQTAIFIRNDRGSAEDAQMLDELRQLSEQLPLYQQQARRFFELVLDVDSAGWEPQAQAARNYTYDVPTIRRCKNCGRYFAQTGRVSAEYCERPVPDAQQRCRDIGALKQWTLRQAGNDAFKAYRKEYKRRFAWIKAGRISDEDFYAWSEQARAQKKKYDEGATTLEDFQRWLKES